MGASIDGMCVTCVSYSGSKSACLAPSRFRVCAPIAAPVRELSLRSAMSSSPSLFPVYAERKEIRALQIKKVSILTTKNNQCARSQESEAKRRSTITCTRTHNLRSLPRETTATRGKSSCRPSMYKVSSSLMGFSFISIVLESFLARIVSHLETKF